MMAVRREQKMVHCLVRRKAESFDTSWAPETALKKALRVMADMTQ